MATEMDRGAAGGMAASADESPPVPGVLDGPLAPPKPHPGLPLAVWAGGLSLMVLALLAWLLRG